jgi:hypothetical protein
MDGAARADLHALLAFFPLILIFVAVELRLPRRRPGFRTSLATPTFVLTALGAFVTVFAIGFDLPFLRHIALILAGVVVSTSAFLGWAHLAERTEQANREVQD